MKKIFARPLCIILMLAMLVPMMSVFASAAELTNLYDASKAAPGTPSNVNRDDPVVQSAPNFYTTHAIEVKPGDVVTFGPVHTLQTYYLTTYDADGAVKIERVAYADCTKVDQILPLAEIVQWTVPEGVTSLRFATCQIFYDSTILTVNQPFNTADYFAYMDKAGVNVDYLRPVNTTETLVNVFPKSDDVFLGRADKNNNEIAADAYRTSPAIPVKEGDILYFGGAVLEQGYSLVLLDENGKGTTTVNYKYMVRYAEFGEGLGILAYRMRPGTAYVRVVCSTDVYDAGKQLVTINQPFTAEGYNNYFNPPETTESAPETTAPETTEPGSSTPTGDSALLFAAIAMISLVGVAVIAKRREN